MNNLDKQYTALLQDILNNGHQKGDRTGTGTISVFGRQIRHKMSEGFPLITTKKMYWNGIVTELIWFLRGDTNIKFLVDNDCHIWDGDAYKNYQNKVKFSSNPYDFKIKDSKSLKLNGKEVEGWGQFQIEGEFSKEEFINKIKTDDEFAKKWGELGPIYGKQWRKWGEEKQMDLDTSTVLRVENGIEKHPYKEFISKQGIDQIANLINDLKTNPDSRRLMVNAWNVDALEYMVLPPCHYGFQVYTRELSLERRYNIWFNNNYETGMERFFDPNNLPDFDDPYYKSTPKRAISLMWNQRSVDTFLGLPFNIASYGLLLEIIAKEVNMVPDELIGNLGDVHLYSNHVEQAKEQIGREPFKLPTITLPSSLQPNSGNWDKLVFEDFYLNNYQSHPSIKAPLSN
jgi:thymidylate synthase